MPGACPVEKPIMRLAILSALIFLVSTAAIGCGERGADPRTSLDGAWLGEGTFHASAGEQGVKAQLELLSDGTYRFLIIEPRVLMLAGMEKGKWTVKGQQLDLAPEPAQTSEGGGILSQAPRDFRPKTLTIESDMSALLLDDSKMDLRFTPNEEATKKLREKGDVE